MLPEYSRDTEYVITSVNIIVITYWLMDFQRTENTDPSTSSSWLNNKSNSTLTMNANHATSTPMTLPLRRTAFLPLLSWWTLWLLVDLLPAASTVLIIFTLYDVIIIYLFCYVISLGRHQWELPNRCCCQHRMCPRQWRIHRERSPPKCRPSPNLGLHHRNQESRHFHSSFFLVWSPSISIFGMYVNYVSFAATPLRKLPQHAPSPSTTSEMDWRPSRKSPTKLPT